MSTSPIYIPIALLDSLYREIKPLQAGIRTFSDAVIAKLSDKNKVVVGDITLMPGRLTIDCDYVRSHSAHSQNTPVKDDTPVRDELSKLINAVFSRCGQSTLTTKANAIPRTNLSNINEKRNPSKQKSVLLDVYPMYIAADYIEDDDL